MFVILLKFSTNRAHAGEWMNAHKTWLQQGFDDGVFVASGSLQGPLQGGCILATGMSHAELAHRLSQDPFVAHDVVQTEVIDWSVSRADPRLTFLMEPTA